MGDTSSDDRGDGKRRYREEGSSRRYRSRSRSPEMERGRRSRTLDSRGHRSRSRDRERRRAENGSNRESPKRRRDENHGTRRPRHRESDRRVDHASRSPDPRSPRPMSRRGRDAEDGERSNGRSLVRRSGPLPSQHDSFAVSKGEEAEKPKEKPNFGNTGLLAAASKTVTQADGTKVTLKYHEPPEARKPPPGDSWKLFVFKGQDIVDTIELSSRSCWLVGRDLTVVDLPAEHPSISKQHAVIQFRYTEKRNEYGDKIGRVKPYLIDLESANGTMINNEKVPESRFLELRNKDMIQFGSSTREYVLMHAPKQ